MPNTMLSRADIEKPMLTLVVEAEAIVETEHGTSMAILVAMSHKLDKNAVYEKLKETVEESNMFPEQTHVKIKKIYTTIKVGVPE